ncbi:hypothetical protein PCANC_05372 [Puccinia coronata f. sp. avenae]|uniref:Phytase A n=1 Tax=Puccinia coronata f. sp. avenae TaxID=200324 RepID=A0A2N5VXB9_9BASI|nr:hypothetical protein PCANC_05372 [Puccinia coronata f. sp. avenae]
MEITFILLSSLVLSSVEAVQLGQQQIHLSLSPADDSGPSSLPDWIVRHAGPIAPFHQIGSYEPPPTSCKVVQVNQLQRHGSRYPTAKVNKRIQRAIRKLQQASHLHESISFLTKYQYRLGEDSLLPLGASESFNAGVQLASRYPHLVDPQHLPFIRASSSQRVVHSAHNFSSGFAAHIGIPLHSIKPIVISEDHHSNNTLDNNSCPNRKSNRKKKQWLKTFGAKITDRLNSLAVNAGLDNKDTLALMQLCIFESLAEAKLSNFCQLFDHADWSDYSYYYDLDKYYNHGQGNPLGQAEGLGYVAELFTRLTGDTKWVEQDQSKVNQTLDRSWVTFPLDRSSYVDFSHDNQMISILAALGLPATQTLPETGAPSSPKSWDVSKWMPFGSRLTVEKMACGPRQNEFVRFILNDMVLNITSCKSGHDYRAFNEDPTICQLSHFLESRTGLLEQSKNLHEQCSI